MATKTTKVLVAIHGIGDQTAYATVQAVAAQLGNYYDIGAPIPLGRFYPTPPKPAGGQTSTVVQTPTGPVPIIMAPPDPDKLTGFGFAEVYWADIPREVAKDGHVLEETKRWARTIVGRLQLRATQKDRPLPERERVRLETVLDEMIETIAVLERVNLIAAKAGLFKFNLQSLLRDFVADVQIVADFELYRDRILLTVDRVMDAAVQLCKANGTSPELYLVAHSEGSVVAFRALLDALSNPESHEWIKSTRGLMTIGSPIETHHLLWPGLWDKLTPKAGNDIGKIPWHNYLDFGDPIAYPLAATGDWLKHTGFDKHLAPIETKFSRSYLPGKAHNDYWKDREVFAHFLQEVVKAPPLPDAKPAREPKTKYRAWFTSYGLPYFLVVALLWLATYCLYRPVVAVVTSAPAATSPTASTVFTDVLGIALLLFGMTVGARIPRITNRWRWWLFAAGTFVISMFAYEALVSEGSRWSLGSVFIGASGDAVSQATNGVLWTAGAITFMCGYAANWWPSWGVRLLPITGLIAAVGLVAGLVFGGGREHLEIWPMVLGAVAFFYLWWIATLLFDLVFVWHRFVRHSTTATSIFEICQDGYTPAKVEAFVTRKGRSKAGRSRPPSTGPTPAAG
jgi:hypothetical protein